MKNTGVLSRERQGHFNRAAQGAQNTGDRAYACRSLPTGDGVMTHSSDGVLTHSSAATVEAPS
jgi:hypothetical protein